MKEKGKKKAVVALSAAIASAGLFLASAFSSPTDLLENLRHNEDEHNATVEIAQSEYKKKSFIEQIPFLIRACIALPLWLLGSLLLKLISGLVKLVLSPVVSFILSLLLIFFILLGIILLVLKLLFPDKSIKELLNKKIIITTFIGSLTIKIVDIILKHTWANYDNYRFLIIFILGLIVIAIALVPILVKKSREPRIIYKPVE